MVTQTEAAALARAFVTARKFSVYPEPSALRRMQADRFNRLLGRQEYASDFWVVEFMKFLPPGAAAETPGCVLIEVIDANKEVREVYAGMFSS